MAPAVSQVGRIRKNQSIQACKRCRSRKVRCDGIHPTCNTCSTSSVECLWPCGPNRRGRRPAHFSASTSTSSQQPNPSSGELQAVSIRKPAEPGPVARAEQGEQSLATPRGDREQIVLEQSDTAWLQHGLVLPGRKELLNLWEIFLRSSYIEVFGVFHKPSITSQIIRGQLSPGLALGICMHAARFSSIEIAKHGSSLAAASHYGDFAAKYLAIHSSTATLDTIIAMLLLSLHEFSMKRGRDSWFHLGIAIRAVLSLDLGKEISDDRLDVLLSSTPWKIRECRRRCFWSCFVVERLLASGTHPKNVLFGSLGHPRHHLMDLTDVNIQLPCAENDFMFFQPILSHDSAEVENGAMSSLGPPSDGTATFGHLIKACEIWGALSRWIFCESQETLSSALTEGRIAHAFRSLEQWESGLPPRCTWNFENYTAHSIPGVALGSSFLFMHLVGRIGFVLLGLNAISRAAQYDLVRPAMSLSDGGTVAAPGLTLAQVISKASESSNFILDISNDPLNLLGTTFLDYALYLSCLLIMKQSLLQWPQEGDTQKDTRDPLTYLYQTFDVYKRRTSYWTLTRAYSRVLRLACEDYVATKHHESHIHDFGTSIEYGSIENMDHRDAEPDDEGKHIQEMQSRLFSETNLVNSTARTSSQLDAVNDVPGNLHSVPKDDILDIDGLLAAQGASEAIQTSLSTTNDLWWSNLFGDEPALMDSDILPQKHISEDLDWLFG